MAHIMLLTNMARVIVETDYGTLDMHRNKQQIVGTRSLAR